MKFDFTRITVATSVTVALTCFSNVAWADCYQDGYNDGYNDGFKACPTCPALPNCQEGDYDKGFQEGKASVNVPNCQEDYNSGYQAGKDSVILPNCQEGDYNKGLQEGKDSVKLPNCQDGDYDKGYQAGRNSVSVPNCKENDYDLGRQDGIASVKLPNCHENDYTNGYNDGRNSVTVPNCQDDYKNGKTEAELAYTGYVDTSSPSPTVKSCNEAKADRAECAKKQGFKEGYNEGEKRATAQYTGYVDLTSTKPKSCNEANADAAECANKEGFDKGYEKGKLAGHKETTGYVKDGVVKSCNETDVDPAECAKMQGFKEGYDEGQAAATKVETSANNSDAYQLYTGYVDENGTAQSCQGVPEDSKANQDSKEAKCANKDGFKDGFNLGQLSLAGYVIEEDGNSVAKSCQEDTDQCQSVPKKGFTEGYNLGLGQKATNSAGTTAIEKPMTDEELKTCQENPTECPNGVFKQGYDVGQKAAPDTLADCKKNPQSCIIAYLQGFYDYFVQKRLQNVNVTNKEQFFPESLKVETLGGIDSEKPAAQWRYTWKHKTQGCEALEALAPKTDKSGNRLKMFEGDNQEISEISICVEQAEDMGSETDSTKPEFGGSKTTSLTADQSLGYTVYLIEGKDDSKKVKATMEIIFSPNVETTATPAANVPTSDGNVETEGAADANTSIPDENTEAGGVSTTGVNTPTEEKTGEPEASSTK